MEWYLSDHLGSTTLLVNESGLEVERTDYYPYGQVQSGGLEKYGFTGQENDADTELMYYGARYYSPEYRVFVQPDTMLPDPYNPQYLNRYAYALNNPVKYTDPSGHFVVPVILGTIAVASVVSLAYDFNSWNHYQMSNAEFGLSLGLEVIPAGKAYKLGKVTNKTIKAAGDSKIIKTTARGAYDAARKSYHTTETLFNTFQNKGFNAGIKATETSISNHINQNIEDLSFFVGYEINIMGAGAILSNGMDNKMETPINADNQRTRTGDTYNALMNSDTMKAIQMAQNSLWSQLYSYDSNTNNNGNNSVAG